MSFASDTGYLPITIPQIMSILKDNINIQFNTSYTDDTFIGTNFYKYFYAMAQRLQQNEIKTSEIFIRMQEYFVITNENIKRPNTTHPGIYDYFTSKGYIVSTKPPADVDAGKAFICVDVDETADDYDDVVKPAVCAIVKDCVVAGCVSQGTEVEAITLSNGQSFDFKFTLPTRIPVDLRLTTTLSDNNSFTISSPDDTKQVLFNNINSKYGLGKNFEPQRYFSILDVPWASSILLEWSTDGVVWNSTIYVADYDEVFTFELTDITLVET